MPAEQYIPVFNWAIPELTVAERTRTLKEFWHHIEPLIKPGLRALDLCCGSGAAAFMMAESGAEVTAIDSSPLLIAQGRAENEKRQASVSFIQADVLSYEHEAGAYDLAVVLGNPVLDFPPDRFGGFCAGIGAALKPGAKIVFEYFDGVENLKKWAERSEHTTPEGFAMKFTGYDALSGAYVFELHNPDRDESCTYQGYVYTIPLLRQLLSPHFALVDSHRLADWKFLDVYARKQH